MAVQGSLANITDMMPSSTMRSSGVYTSRGSLRFDSFDNGWIGVTPDFWSHDQEAVSKEQRDEEVRAKVRAALIKSHV